MNNNDFYKQFQNAVGEQIQNVGKQLQKVGEQLQSSWNQEQINSLSEDKEYDSSKTKLQDNVCSRRSINKSQKHILALLIKSDRYQELIHSLKDSNYLKSQDASKLYGATQALWIKAKSEFDKSQIKRELDNPRSVTTTSEYDVHFITIELDGDDFRFYPGVNPMDRRDAFVELGNKTPRITVSPRLSCKAYEHTEFYSR